MFFGVVLMCARFRMPGTAKRVRARTTSSTRPPVARRGSDSALAGLPAARGGARAVPRSERDETGRG